jgi:hypothetical protein
MMQGVERSMILPSRFSDRFLEKRVSDVEKFFIDSREVEAIFCKFEN